MSTSQPLILPHLPGDVVEPFSYDGIRNTNQGSGAQHNATQADGRDNSLYSASVQHFHGHDPRRFEPKQAWRISRQAAGNFAGYSDVSAKLENCLLEQHPRDEQIVCVLSGMGGVGKSEVVLQFLKNHNNALRKRFWAALWVDCSSEATAQADFKRFGNLCGWPLDESDLLYGVKDQLASLDRPSLLLLDNCDDTKTNFNCYIPNSARVSVVLTTRLSDAHRYASLNTQDTTDRLFVRMDGLDPASATQLILGASGIQEQNAETVQHAEQIADALDYHPLAMVVASSLLQSNVYSIKKYAASLKDRLTQKELLDTETEQAAYRKVSATFEISATVLQAQAVSDESAQHALNLLDLLAFMHHRVVSEDIFARAWEYEEEVLSNCVKRDREPQELSMWHVAQVRKYFPYATIDARIWALRKARAHLIRLSLVKQDSEDNATNMHSLVHLWSKERLQHATKPWAASASILALAAQGCQDWQPHSPQLALHCEMNFRLRPTSGVGQFQGEAICRIWSNFAWQMLETRHPQALDVVKHFSREVQSQSRLATNDPLRTEPRYLIGVLSIANGEPSQAVAILEDVVRTRAELAESRPSRLASQLALARAYLGDGRTSDAIEIIEHVVQIEKKELPVDHHNRLASQHELACAYLADERIPQAIEMFEHVVQIEEKKLDIDHPHRLASQHALASAYLEAGRIPQAIGVFEHVVRNKEKLPAGQPTRLASQHELARAYLEAGRTSQAIEVLEHVVHIKEKLAAGHPTRLASQHELASAYLRDKRISQAIELFEHVVHMRESLAADDPIRLRSQHELARAYLKAERIAQAIKVLEHVVHTEEKLSDDHAGRLVSQHELARAYWRGARFAEADKLMSYVVNVRQRELPKGHPDRCVSERALASIREDPKNPAAASKDFTASDDHQQLEDHHEIATPSHI